MKPMRVALYLRVSTGEQTTENQRRELEAVAAVRGWQIVAVYEDAGISGAKGRDKRPQLDLMLKDAVRGRFDLMACWSVDRLGRSQMDLLTTMQELRAANVEMVFHQQALDTTTPSGRAMFGMLGVFAEFERSMIQSRVNAGLARAKAAGVKLGRPTVAKPIEKAIRTRLEAGEGVNKIAAALGCGSGTVRRVRASLPG